MSFGRSPLILARMPNDRPLACRVRFVRPTLEPLESRRLLADLQLVGPSAFELQTSNGTSTTSTLICGLEIEIGVVDIV
jgi:hypothetical protein